jgi:DNA modification methylase
MTDLVLPLNTIVQGHTLDILRRLPSESVQCCITSPPYYGLRNYGTTPQTFSGRTPCDDDCDWQDAAPRRKRLPEDVIAGTKQDTNTGTKHQLPHTLTCAVCGAWHGELGLEPTPELYITHLVEIFREVRRVLKPTGTLWLNIGDSYTSGKSRYSTKEQTVAGGGERSEKYGVMHNGGKPDMYYHPTLKDKDLMLIPARLAIALQEDGWYVRADIIWEKPNCMPESVRDRPTKSHEYIFLLTKSPSYFYDAEAVREPYTKPLGRWGGNTLVANGHSSWSEATKQPAYRNRSLRPNENGRNCRTVWKVNTRNYKGAHFATFPPELIRRPILAGTVEGDTVLDPFMGAGTTALVARQHGRKYVGIELNPAYIKLAEERLANESLTQAA